MSMQPKSEDVQSGRRSLLGSCSFFYTQYFICLSPMGQLHYGEDSSTRYWLDWKLIQFTPVQATFDGSSNQASEIKPRLILSHLYAVWRNVNGLLCTQNTNDPHSVATGKKKLILNVKSVAFFSQLHTSDIMPDFQTDLCNGFTTAPDKIQSAQKWPMCKKLTWF